MIDLQSHFDKETTRRESETSPLLFQKKDKDNNVISGEKDEDDEDSAVASFSSHPLLRRLSTFWPSERGLLKRFPSLELLVPAHDCESRRSSPAIAIFNLVATVCGGGVLSLPQAFGRAGLIPSTVLMLFSAGITHFSMYILCSCARRTGGRSYGDVMRNAFGPAAEVGATVLLAFLLFFVLVAYQVLLKDIWTPVLLQAFPMLKNVFMTLDDPDSDGDQVSTDANNDSPDMARASHYMLVALLLCTAPLLLQTDLHALRHTCYVGFGSAIVLMLGVTQQALWRNLYQQPGIFAQKVKWVGDLDGIMYAFPIIVLSFFSIYNVLTVHGALYNPTRSRVKFVLDGTIGLCFVLFFTVGVSGYLYSYDETSDNILLNFPLDIKTVLVGRIGYGVTIMFGMPLVFLPCRAAILSLPEQIREQNIEIRHPVANSLTFDEECPLLKETKRVRSPKGLKSGRNTSTDQSCSGSTSLVSIEEEQYLEVTPIPKVDPSLGHEAARDRRVHIISTAAILVLSYIMAVAVPGVGVVWSIAGSSIAIIIGFIIPSACYLKIRSKKSVNPRSVGAVALLVFSIFISIDCTIRTIQSL
eukprot:scaffold6566_cov125-Amphora_coffeaeformis.AAC.11